jgi:hypothetical protein
MVSILISITAKAEDREAEETGQLAVKYCEVYT